MLRENKKMKMMMERSSPERVYAFSDGVFAIVITIMILELKKPQAATFQALFQLWPTWISYGASYLFIAIVWVNHHYLLRRATKATLRLMWANFSHLFCVSLIPFLTDWVAETDLASVPVAMYAVLFFLVNVTYFALVWQTLCDPDKPAVSVKAMWLLNVRSFLTMALFLAAMILAFWFPVAGFALVCCCLLLYLRPDMKTRAAQMSASRMMKKTKM